MSTKQFNQLIILTLITLNSILTQIILGSSCTYLNNNLYILGGIQSSEKGYKPYNKSFYINLTKNFNLVNFTINNNNNNDNDNEIIIENNHFEGLSYGAAFTTNSLINKENNEEINNEFYLYGNQFNKIQTHSNIYYIESIPLTNDKIKSHYTLQYLTTEDSPPNRYGFSKIQVNQFAYIWGGMKTENNKVTNEFWKLDTKNLKWEKMPNLNNINGLVYSKSIYLNDDRMVVLGGINEDNKVMDLSQIYIYNFKTYEWITIETKGENHYPIIGFEPVFYNDAIYFQGGANSMNTTSTNYELYSDLLKLDIQTWTISKILLKDKEGNLAKGIGRSDYSSYLIGDQYIQIFGKTSNESLNPYIQIINLSNYSISDNYIADTKTLKNLETTSVIIEKTGLSTLYIIIISISCIVFILIVIIITFFIYRKQRQLQTFKKEKSMQSYYTLVRPFHVESINYKPNSSYHSLNSTLSHTSLNPPSKARLL